MSAPFMQLYVADYLGDTQHLTAEQHGAYLLLLMTMWRQGGSLPNDPRMLARIARISPRRWHLIAPEVMAFFDEAEGTITQKRLVEEYQKAVSKSEKRSASGKLGGNAKSLKSRKGRVSNAKQLPKHLLQTPEPEEEEAKASPSEARDDEKAAFDAYNEMAERTGMPVAQSLNETRRGKIAARLSEVDGLPGWIAALQRAEASSFCTGRKTDFRADLDFLLQAKSFTRLIEGSYDDNPNQRGFNEQRHSHTSNRREAIDGGVEDFFAAKRLRQSDGPRSDDGGPQRSTNGNPRQLLGREITYERGTGSSYGDSASDPVSYGYRGH